MYKMYCIRDRPFNLKGGIMFFCFVQNFFFGQHKLYDKNSESDYFFFPPPKSEYFFQQHWESEYFVRKKTYPPPFKLNGRSLTCDKSVVSLGPPIASTIKTDRHDITGILLKVALNTIKQTNIFSNGI